MLTMIISKTIILLCTILLSIPFCFASNFINTTQISTLYEPSVVQITVHYTAIFILPYPEFNWVNGEFIFQPQSEQYFNKIESNWKGTGFIITPDGYIITNAHISNAEYYKKIEYLREQTLEIAALFLDDQLIQYDQYDFFIDSYYHYLTDYGNFTSETQQIMIDFGGELYSAKQVISGDPIGLRSSKDIAILKIDPSYNYLLPTVQLGNSSKVNRSDTIIALGFPETSYDSQNFICRPQSHIGTILQIKSMGNWSALQTDTEITFGYSGGPVFNLNGEVVAVSTFGAISPMTQTTEHFLLPINIALDLLKEISVENTRGPIDNYYRQGLEHFWHNDYNHSIIFFQNVLLLNPNHNYAYYYLKMAQSRLKMGSNYTLTSRSTIETISSTTENTDKLTILTRNSNNRTGLSSSILDSTIPLHDSQSLQSNIALYLILSVLIVYLLFFIIKRYRIKAVSYLRNKVN